MHPATKLIEALPEFAGRYPLELVLDPWSDRIRERARNGEPIDDALELVETLAREGDARVRNALQVTFLEVFATEALGPAAEALRDG